MTVYSAVCQLICKLDMIYFAVLGAVAAGLHTPLAWPPPSCECRVSAVRWNQSGSHFHVRRNVFIASLA